jgi:hypothetical protein
MDDLRNLVLSATVTLLAAKNVERDIPERVWLYDVAEAAAADVVSDPGEETATANALSPYLETTIEIGEPPGAKARALLVRVVVGFHGFSFLFPVRKSPYLLLVRDIAYAILTGRTGSLEECFAAIRQEVADGEVSLTH